ncbi:MAG: hypothetical protein LBR79_07240 [Oscillospiraceae bacterium]|jgi:hypothetical protein|nr:hypothetical protein [Oscillospiraceae bacterium]
MTLEDKSSKTIQAIREYDDAKLTIQNASLEITQQNCKLKNPSNSRLNNMPKMRNLHVTEEMWTAGIDKLDLMHKRYYEAKTFIMWFEPMWLTLTPNERKILETYKWSDTHSGFGKQLASDLGHSVRNLHRIRQKLLKRFSKLLHGK